VKAHQRIVREQKAIEETNGLFGAWWEEINTDIKTLLSDQSQ